LFFSDLSENPFIYGGCAHFSAFPASLESDPFGAALKMAGMPVFTTISVMSP
jgi:hypothetical protein